MEVNSLHIQPKVKDARDSAGCQVTGGLLALQAL